MDLEEDWFPYQTGHRLARHFAELISDIFRSIDGGHDPRYGIWNHPACLLCQRVNIIRIYSKVEDYEIENKTRVDTEYK